MQVQIPIYEKDRSHIVLDLPTCPRAGETVVLEEEHMSYSFKVQGVSHVISFGEAVVLLECMRI